MAKAKGNMLTIGQNVTFERDNDGTLVFRVDPDVSLGQTKGSQEPGKTPNEKVASTGAAVTIPGSNAKVVLHVYQPMEVKAVRRARAEREIASEDRAVAVAAGGGDDLDDAMLDAIADKIMARLGAS